VKDQPVIIDPVNMVLAQMFLFSWGLPVGSSLAGRDCGGVHLLLSGAPPRSWPSGATAPGAVLPIGSAMSCVPEPSARGTVENLSLRAIPLWQQTQAEDEKPDHQNKARKRKARHAYHPPIVHTDLAEPHRTAARRSAAPRAHQHAHQRPAPPNGPDTRPLALRQSVSEPRASGLAAGEVATAPRHGWLRAARLTGPARAAMERLRLPDPGAGQVRVALEGCGVCGSDLGPWACPEWMEFPTPPGAPGHEGWGRIDALGAGVYNVQVGQRVALLGQRSYASHDIVAADGVVALPPALDGQPFPGEALGCAMNIFRRSAIGPGDQVAIIGIGFIGALLTRLAADAGAQVIAISRRDTSLALARRMGAAQTIPMRDHDDIIRQVRSLTDGAFCDIVIEAVGKQWPLDLAGEIVREGGRLVVAGYHQDGPRQVNMQLWNWRGIDVVNAHERDPRIVLQGIHDAIAAVVEGRLDPAPLYTHRFTLDRLAAALDAARDKPDGFVKALITCR